LKIRGGEEERRRGRGKRKGTMEMGREELPLVGLAVASGVQSVGQGLRGGSRPKSDCNMNKSCRRGPNIAIIIIYLEHYCTLDQYIAMRGIPTATGEEADIWIVFFQKLPPTPYQPLSSRRDFSFGKA
jgi:hypothetical protein